MNPESWSSVEFFSTGDSYFESVIQSCDQAQESIFIESYIFSVDSLTRTLVESLSKAQNRGVEVRILVDGFGSYFWLQELQRLCTFHKLSLRVYHPLPRNFQWLKSIFHLFTLRIPFLLKKWNRRNHRKLILIDHQRAYIGSYNLTQVHSEKHYGSKAWKDFGVSLQGPPLLHFQRAFQNTWAKTQEKKVWKTLIQNRFDQNYTLTNNLARLNSSLKMRRRLKRDMIKKMQDAQNKIWIVSAYFLPQPFLMGALKKAAQRGVSVCLILPGLSDVPLVKWAAFTLYKKLLKEGVEIFEYQKSVLHAKYMVIDNFGIVGSHNLNHRSLLHDLEIEAGFVDTLSVQRIEFEFKKDLLECRPLKITELQKWPWYKQILSSLAYRLRYLL